VTTRVLICDDEPALRELMRVALVGDYEFAEAGSVSESIEVGQEFKPHIALVDVMMPGGSGLEVVRALGGTKCLVVSAFAAEADQEEAREAGAVGFVSKPFDPDELSTAVAELVTDDG
jgi:two-component system chemotaxis response regulator CheY